LLTYRTYFDILSPYCWIYLLLAGYPSSGLRWLRLPTRRRL